MCEESRDTRPRLVWLSVSHVGSPDDFLAAYGQLERAASELQIPLVVGGQRLDEHFRVKCGLYIVL